jgi:S-DNA-T family DNA segregation ATPase FtsK/SpoIIIE
MSKDRDQTGEAVAIAVAATAVVGWLIARWAWRHPTTTAWAIVSVLAYTTFGPVGVLGLWAWAVVLLAGWWCFGRPSFTRAVSWRARGSWRGWWVYGRRWRTAITMADLGDYYQGARPVPRLRRVRSNPYMDRLTVQLLAGQHPSDFQSRADTLAHTFGQLACRARIAGPGSVYLDFTRRDLLAATVPAFPLPETPDLRALPVGRREDGADWTVGLLGRHTLIAGETGAGKGSVLQSLIRPCGPMIRSGLLRLYGIDPKGGMELAAAGAEVLYDRLVREDPNQQAELLEHLVGVMRDRARRLAGVTRLHTPSVEEPLLVLVIDELAALTSYRPRTREGRELYGRIDMATNLLLSQGRAVGVIVIAALQDPRKEVLPSRDLFPTRIALRLTEEEATNMVLGPTARDRGADCSLIDPRTPGVAWAWCDGEPEPTRVRASFVTDEDIADLVNRCYPLPTNAIDVDGAQLIDLTTAPTPERVQ